MVIGFGIKSSSLSAPNLVGIVLHECHYLFSSDARFFISNASNSISAGAPPQIPLLQRSPNPIAGFGGYRERDGMERKDERKGDAKGRER